MFVQCVWVVSVAQIWQKLVAQICLPFKLAVHPTPSAVWAGEGGPHSFYGLKALGLCLAEPRSDSAFNEN